MSWASTFVTQPFMITLHYLLEWKMANSTIPRCCVQHCSPPLSGLNLDPVPHSRFGQFEPTSTPWCWPGPLLPLCLIGPKWPNWAILFPPQNPLLRNQDQFPHCSYNTNSIVLAKLIGRDLDNGPNIRKLHTRSLILSFNQCTKYPKYWSLGNRGTWVVRCSNPWHTPPCSLLVGL